MGCLFRHVFVGLKSLLLHSMGTSRGNANVWVREAVEGTMLCPNYKKLAMSGYRAYRQDFHQY